MGITHTFVSAKADGGDATLVRPSNWNAVHTIDDVVRVVDRDVILTDVVASVAETTVYSFNVPANTLGTNKAIKMELIGDYLNSSGADAGLIVRIKFGATTLAAFSFSGIPTQALRRSIFLETLLSALNSTSVQVAWSRGTVSNAGGVSGVGSAMGIDITGTSPQVASVSSVPEDSTAIKALVVTFENSVNSGVVSARSLIVQTRLIG